MWIGADEKKIEKIQWDILGLEATGCSVVSAGLAPPTPENTFQDFGRNGALIQNLSVGEYAKRRNIISLGILKEFPFDVVSRWGTISLGFEKVFDKINHNAPLNKLFKFGFCLSTISFTASMFR